VYVGFEQWTGNREVATLGTNAGSAAIPFQRWRHFKEAFAPEIVYEAVRAAETPVKTCIDPFGGSGTTALACQFLGVEPTTIEVNPYLADLIEAKLSTYDPDRLVQDLGTILRNAERIDPAATLAGLPATLVEPGVANRWIFDLNVARRILCIRAAVEQLGTPAHRRLFKVLLGGVLVGLSNAVVNGKGRRYRRGWDKRTLGAGDVDAAFTDAASAAIGEIGRYGSRAAGAYAVIRGDSREAIKDLGAFDLAVFSPPYPNSFDYTDVYNIELWMLGYLTGSAENRSLRESTLASHVQIHRSFAAPPPGSQHLADTLGMLEAQKEQLWNPHIPAMVGAYFTEMLGIVEALGKVLRPRGTIWAVVGDSRYAGVAVNVANILGELATANGLKVDRLETLREMRASAQQGGQAQLAESLIVIRHA
jgi:DNA modification methylase